MGAGPACLSMTSAVWCMAPAWVGSLLLPRGELDGMHTRRQHHDGGGLRGETNAMAVCALCPVVCHCPLCSCVPRRTAQGSAWPGLVSYGSHVYGRAGVLHRAHLDVSLGYQCDGNRAVPDRCGARPRVRLLAPARSSHPHGAQSCRPPPPLALSGLCHACSLQCCGSPRQL